jgi:hypothetical protein
MVDFTRFLHDFAGTIWRDALSSGSRFGQRRAPKWQRVFGPIKQVPPGWAAVGCFHLVMLQCRRQLKMQFLVHSKTIAELEYDSETCVLRVLYKDGRMSSVPDVAPTLVMKIVARVPVEKSPYLMQTAI